MTEEKIKDLATWVLMVAGHASTHRGCATSTRDRRLRQNRKGPARVLSLFRARATICRMRDGHFTANFYDTVTIFGHSL